MKISVVPGKQLTAEQAAAWSQIQRAEASLESPYFRPEFTQAVAAVRDDVEVAILEEAGAAVGFFPFQRGTGNVAAPVGGRLCDFQGVVVRGETAWDPRQLLRECGLAAWHFDHLIAAQQPLRPYHWKTADSPFLDLSQGWQGYVTGQRARHKESFKTLLRKLRHAEREAGPLSIEYHSEDRGVFDALLEWKRQQYRRTGVLDVLAVPWTVALLERVWQASGAEFSGVLTSLRLGGRLAAALLSLRSGPVLHTWFSAYDTELAHYSSGLMLFLELGRIAETQGIRQINLGKGPETYKEQIRSGAVELAEGSVDLRPVAGLLRRQWRRAYDWVRSSPLRRPLRAPGRLVRRLIESEDVSMIGTICQGVLLVLSAIVLLPMLALSLECLAALLPRRRPADYGGRRPRVAVLIPAHDEEAVIEATLQSVQAGMANGDRLLVVADNCGDGTAAVARRAGAMVVERYDAEHRGKGYALEHGLAQLRDDPPEVVVVIDADCLAAAGAIEATARLARQTRRPVQAVDLTDRRPAAGAMEAAATLGNRFSNLVRPLGMARLGVPCRLLGTGMALPWPILGSARLGTGNLVEDMQLGIDLAIAGHAPLFCPEAKVASALPPRGRAMLSQRTRWEQGHLHTAATQVPRLLGESLRQRRPGLFWMACDLAIPPLAPLAAAWAASFACAAAAWLLGAGALPLLLAAGGGLALAVAVAAAWTAFCREQVPWTVLAAIPAYLWRKLPIYAGLLWRRQQAWVRTEREPGPDAGVRSLRHDPAHDRHFSVLGVRFTNVTRQRALGLVEELIRRPDGRAHAVFFANAHTLNLAAVDPEYRDVLSAADYVFADGTGVRWAARLQKVRVRENLVGTDFTPALLRETAGRGYSYFLLGGDLWTIERTAEYARQCFPGWTLRGYHHGYLANPRAEAAVIEQIRSLRPDLLLVGMGNPLQERWIRQHQDRLGATVCMAIGGLFDLWAGSVSRAPHWLRRLGHEWLWRLFQQPKDKARRYLVGNPAFLARVLRERLSGRLPSPGECPDFHAVETAAADFALETAASAADVEPPSGDASLSSADNEAPARR